MTYDERPHRHTKHKGQTLVEFALTLPILLLLIFGVIEFGRAFQAWITLENAAREAARYTTTGQYDTAKYDLMELFPCTQADYNNFNNIRDGILRGDIPHPNYRENPPAKIFTEGGTITPQTLFATYYDGRSCQPGDPDDLERRKDIVRLASIYDVARRAATGLNMEPSLQDGTLQPLFDQLANRWEPNSERSQRAGYFDVLVCSTRSNINEDSNYIHSGSSSRFHMVYDISDLPSGTTVPQSRQHWNQFNPPYCLLNELQPIDGRVVDNSGLPWIDAGGPGDRITVVVTLNHTLLTPIFDYSYLPMQARRSGVNETFRTSRALNAVQGGAQIGGFPDRDPGLPSEEETPTDEPTSENPTEDPSAEPTEDLVPTQEITPPPAFTCDSIYISDITFLQNAVDFTITNNNYKSAVLQSVRLAWNIPSSPDMRLSSSSLNGEVHWTTTLTVPPKPSIAWLADPNAPPEERTQWNRAARNVLGTGATGTESAVSRYRAVFINTNLTPANPITASNFAGTDIRVYHPDYGECQIQIEIQNPPTNPTQDVTAEPTLEPTPYRPDCSQDLLTVRFDRFETLGVVVLRVENRRDNPSPILGFNLRWFDHLPEPPYRGRESKLPGVTQAGQVYLNQVRVGPLSSTAFSGTTTLWNGNASLRTSPTINTPGARTHGTWLNNYNVPPHSAVNLYLDFDGSLAAGRLDASSVGMERWMIDGDFWIDCLHPDGTLEGNHNPDYISFGEDPPPTPTPPTPTPEPNPQIAIRNGNWNTAPIIANNDTLILGDVVRGRTATQTYRIHNIGPWGDLSSTATIEITGDRDRFSWNGNISSWGPLGPFSITNSVSDFNITCRGDRVGNHTITVRVRSNANNIPDYRFQLTCPVIDTDPDIRVEDQWGNHIAKNNTYYMNSVTVGQTSSSTLQIRNTGTSTTKTLNRNNQSITITGQHASKFQITSGANWGPLANNATSPFSFTCRSDTPGTFTARVRIPNNSANNNPYEFNISCTVNAVVIITPEPTPEPTEEQPVIPVVPTRPGQGGGTT